MTMVIRSKNKMRLVEKMYEPPRISGVQIAEELGISRVTVYRWMQDPNDEQTERMIKAIRAIRAKGVE